MDEQEREEIERLRERLPDGGWPETLYTLRNDVDTHALARSHGVNFGEDREIRFQTSEAGASLLAEGLAAILNEYENPAALAEAARLYESLRAQTPGLEDYKARDPDDGPEGWRQ